MQLIFFSISVLYIFSTHPYLNLCYYEQEAFPSSIIRAVVLMFS